MSPLRYLGTIALAFSSLCVVHTGLFVYQMGAPLPAEYWLYESRIVKRWLVRDLPSPKLLVAGGSNVLFGVDSALLEESLGVPTFNVSLHGRLFLWQTLPDVQADLAPGDHVLLIPGFETYPPAPRYDSWLTSQVMTWDAEYFWQRGAVEKIRFIGSVPFPRIVAGCLMQAIGRDLPGVAARRLRPPAEIIEEYERRSPSRVTDRASVYSPLNLTTRGDIDRTLDVPVDRSDYGLGGPFRENRDTWNTLKAFRDFCRAHDIRVYFSWPPMRRSRGLTSDPVRRQLLEIRRRVQELGIPILGEPEEFVYDKSLFSDTPYHLNHRGRDLRTRQLVRLLRDRLPFPEPAQGRR
jgi:hypothetical protein